jgi:hypothetical protein
MRGVFRIEWKNVDAQTKKSFEQACLRASVLRGGGEAMNRVRSRSR